MKGASMPFDEAFRGRLLRQGLSNDEMAQVVELTEKLWASLDELLSVAERMRGGDLSLDPEEWFAARDYARKVLNG